MKIKEIIKNQIEKFKKFGLFKKILVVLILVGVIFGSYKFIYKKEVKLTYKFANIEKGTISNLVSETGEITATGRTEVKSTIKGIVKEVYVDNGAWVEKGQELFYVTSSASEPEQASAWGSYQSTVSSLNSAKTAKITSQASLEQGRVNILNQADTVNDMNDNLNDGNFDEYTRNQIDATNADLYIDRLGFSVNEANFLNADQSIAAAQTKLNSAWYAYQATIDGTVKSPVAGYINNLAIAPGQNVDVSTSDVTAANSMVIKSAEETWIKIAVSEMEIPKIKVGQNAQITIDALGTDKFKALVKRMDEIGTNSGGIVTFGVYLLVNDSNESIKPGMTAQVDIEIEKKDNVLVVPNSAIKTYQGEKVVQVLDKETNEILYYPIEVGSVDDINTEVISGADEGQQLIISVTTDTANTTSTNNTNGMRFPGMGGK